jgi:DNA-binding NarL/FixJ family response regulator
VTTVAALVPDLMDRSRISAATPISVVFVGLADLRDLDVDILIADLGRIDQPGDLRAAAPRSRIVGFGSHVDEEMLDAARAAGIDEVLPRSVFFRKLGELLE